MDIPNQYENVELDGYVIMPNHIHGIIIIKQRTQASSAPIYARDFTNGKILVNPTLKTYNIFLDKDYYTLDGELVSELAMESHTGKILLIKSH